MFSDVLGAICGRADFIRSLMDLHLGPIMLLGPTIDPKIASELSLRIPHLGIRMVRVDDMLTCFSFDTCVSSDIQSRNGHNHLFLACRLSIPAGPWRMLNACNRFDHHISSAQALIDGGVPHDKQNMLSHRAC